MSTDHPIDKAGVSAGAIDVRLSYRIVELFSEGLYASPNKAIEELVANSFDAGARNVVVEIPADTRAQGANIVVFDDGEGMDAEGLRRHWLIGVSNKRELEKLPSGRAQIGKFGIGKLATYVLANRLSHISKRADRFFATSMDYERIDKRVDGGVEPKTPIRIGLRELNAKEAAALCEPWISTDAFKRSGVRLFGKGASNSWTLALLSDLKPKVHEIKPGVLEWVLRTALPLRDDFSIVLNGAKLVSSKAAKGRIKRWLLGKDLTQLPKPAPAGLEVSEDGAVAVTEPTHYGLTQAVLGRMTGYAEAYEELLTGKSDQIGRSHGFFVYVRQRLINVTDGHFGIKPDELRHGTFGRIRVVVHIDALDEFLQSDRERVREGPVLEDVRNLLRAIFNVLRGKVDEHDAGESSGAQLARRFADSPSSISRRPILELARRVASGSVRSRSLRFEEGSRESREHQLQALESRLETPAHFITSTELVYDATAEDGVAAYEVGTGKLLINGLHPFIGAFSDSFDAKSGGLPLEVFALGEILLEAHLHAAGVAPDALREVLQQREALLRAFADESEKRTPRMIANALRNARNDKDRLEQEVVSAFRSLGFDAERLGGSGKPDGLARAHLSGDGEARRFGVSLEAKSKQKDGVKLTAKAFSVSTIARHRDEHNCDHAIVVAPGFEHTEAKEGALALELRANREQTEKAGRKRTITAITIDDLARLVELQPLKRIGLAQLRDLFESCALPEESARWIDRESQRAVAVPPWAVIVRTIHEQQKEFDSAAVTFGALRVALSKATPPYRLVRDDEVAAFCRAMASIAPGYVHVTDRAVELNQSPANVLAAIQQAGSQA